MESGPVETSPKLIRVFVASPGDVATERAMAHEVLEKLQRDAYLHDRITVQPVAWDQPGAATPMLATMTPQEAINRGLPKPSECDIVIVILWSRIGSPLPAGFRRADGSLYLSGTEWEFEDAVHAEQRPHVLLYRRLDAVSFEPNDPDLVEKSIQMRSVNEFFAKRFQNPDGSQSGGVNIYRKPQDFKERLEEHLRKIIIQLLEAGDRSRRPARQAGEIAHQARVHLSAGDRLAARGRYREAIQEYETAAEIDTNGEILRRIVATKREQLVRRAFGPGSNLGIAIRHDWSSFQLVPNAEVDAALAVLYRLQALDPALDEDAGLLLDEAKLMKAGLRLPDAVEVLRQAHALAPANAEVMAELGLLMALSAKDAKQIAEAIAFLRQAVHATPDEAIYHYYLAHSLAETHMCAYAGVDFREGGDEQACAEAIREYRRAADLGKDDDIWEIRTRACEASMDIFHRYARKEGTVLSPKLAMPLEERLRELQYLTRGTRTTKTGTHDEARYWIAELLLATGNPEQAEREMRELLTADHDCWLGNGKNFWEDPQYIESRHLWMELFARILEAR
jgi:tetratricopeptide (TPR) repeat protein